MDRIACIHCSGREVRTVDRKVEDHNLSGLLERAMGCLNARELDKAIAEFNKAEEAGANPNACSGGRWEAFMLLGDMEAAWREADRICSRGVTDPNRFWDGSTLTDRKVIVRCLHGLGDTIQMLPYVMRLLEIANKVILEVQPGLIPLMRRLSLSQENHLEIITWGDQVPVWDVQVEVMELSYIFRTRLEQLPLARRYLQLPEVDLRLASEMMGETCLSRIGLVWTVGEWNLTRAIPWGLMRSLLNSPAQFWSLVARGHPDDVPLEAADLSLKHASQLGEGILHLSTVIASLDLVITADTLVAHLAGAIGIPVWVLLQAAADWRWMQGETSAWYPSMRLFRQRTPGDWCEVIVRVQKELEARL